MSLHAVAAPSQSRPADEAFHLWCSARSCTSKQAVGGNDTETTSKTGFCSAQQASADAFVAGEARTFQEEIVADVGALKQSQPLKVEIKFDSVAFLAAQDASAAVLGQKWLAPPLWVLPSQTAAEADAKIQMPDEQPEPVQNEVRNKSGKRQRHFREALEQLDLLPSGHLLKVTRTTKLSLEQIATHFSRYGKVQQLVPVMCGAEPKMRTQCGIVYVVMPNASSAAAAAAAREHNVAGVSLVVRAFKTRSSRRLVSGQRWRL